MRKLVDEFYFAIHIQAQTILKDMNPHSTFRGRLMDRLKYWGNWDGNKFLGTKEKHKASAYSAEEKDPNSSKASFYKFIKPSNIDKTRRDHAKKSEQAVIAQIMAARAKKNPKWKKLLENPIELYPQAVTTCNTFIAWPFREAQGKKWVLKGKLTLEMDHEGAKYGASTKADTNMPRSMRPKPGDLYVLGRKDNHAAFEHVGFFISAKPNGDGTETWQTLGAGQGTSGKYVADFRLADPDNPETSEIIVGPLKLAQKGAEEINGSSRVYNPQTNIISGTVSSHDQDAAWLRGWVNIDKFVKEK